MTPAQKILISRLLRGCFLRLVRRRNGASWYVLYDARINPLEKVRLASVQNLDQFIDPKIKIWKKSRDGRLTLNLSMVRRLHGNHLLKKLYKKKQQLEDPGMLYKKRIKKSKIVTNEKVRYLF